MEPSDTQSPSPGLLWPGLWAPLVILLAGLAATALTANLEANKALQLAEARYQAQHQLLVNRVRVQQWENATKAGESTDRTSDWLQPVLKQALPENMGVRVDTLARHTKEPLLHIQTSNPVDASRSLRSEIRAGDTDWMLTTLPAEPFLEADARQSARRIWFNGLLITAVGVVLALWLCRKLNLEQHRSLTLSGQAEVGSRQIHNLETEKTILRQALDDSEQRSRDLVALSGAIICELDEQGIIGFASPQTAELIGEAPSDLVGHPFDQWLEAQSREHFQRALDAARSDHALERVDLFLQHRDGETTVPVTVRVLPLHNPMHGLVGFRLSASANPGS